MATFVGQSIEALGFTAHSDAQGNVWTLVDGSDKAADAVAMAQPYGRDCHGRARHRRRRHAARSAQREPAPVEAGRRTRRLVGDGESLVPAHLSFGSGHTNDPEDPIAQFASGARGIQWSHCRVLTGLTPDQLRARGVRIGTCAVPDSAIRGPHVFGPKEDPLVSAWILDNRGGTLTLLRLLEKIQRSGLQPQRALYLCFMVQEEGGLLGAKRLGP